MARRKNTKNPDNAVLTIRSAQKADNETDASELNSTAHYQYQDGKAEISYTELDEQGEENGKTVITVLNGKLVSIRKTGFTDAVMILETGKTHKAHYHTILGAMDMRLCATDIDADFREEGGTLRMRYLLDIGESYSAVNMIYLQVSLRTES
ncbi:MAG: DUF1934 domain-containing protein [Oscillospiraceae bacterium]|nr:DUF1934 domain-containing protein [Oscillospiraceae bacterium]